MYHDSYHWDVEVDRMWPDGFRPKLKQAETVHHTFGRIRKSAESSFTLSDEAETECLTSLKSIKLTSLIQCS